MKRRLTTMRLDKIAAVDLPCQEHATVAIVKRQPVVKGGPLQIAKATFAEALEAQLVTSRVNQAFYQSFDGLWERNDAFRTSLTDELSSGGDGSAASEDYVASVRELVDEAVSEARTAGKEATDQDLDKALTTAADRWLKSKEQTMTIKTKAELGTAIAKFASAGVAATIGDRDAILKAAGDLKAEDMLPADGPLAKAAPDPETLAIKRRLDIAEMPADVRKHFDAMAEADQTEFLAKSATDRAAIVAKANEDDPVLYTTQKGREIRKSHGQLAADLARDNDELRGDLAKVQGDLTTTTIEKRAAGFPNVAKKVAIDMLKAADAAGAESDTGKAVMATLSNMNKAGSRLLKSIGTTEETDVDAGTGDEQAVADFDKKVDEIARVDKISRSEAMSKARRTEPDLFKRAYPAPEETEEEEEA